jgi:hypothetical protein
MDAAAILWFHYATDLALDDWRNRGISRQLTGTRIILACLTRIQTRPIRSAPAEQTFKSFLARQNHPETIFWLMPEHSGHKRFKPLSGSEHLRLGVDTKVGSPSLLIPDQLFVFSPLHFG